MENDFIRRELNFKNDVANLLIHYFYVYAADPNADGVVYINVYDVFDDECGILAEKIQSIIDRYEDKFETMYVPNVISRTKTIESYPEHIIRECENCGQLIETAEIKSNPHTVYCRHCRVTQFDGPDLYE